MPRVKKANAASPAYFESYAEYNRILRSWFVAFGIGGLALFLLESPVRESLLASGRTRILVVLFLIGVTAQIIVAFLNKYANWYCYFGEDNSAFMRTREPVTQPPSAWCATSIQALTWKAPWAL